MQIIIAVLIVQVACSDVISSTEEYYFGNMVLCIKSIVSTYIHRETVIFYVEDEFNSPLWEHSIQNIDKPLLIMSLKSDQYRNINQKTMIVLFPQLNSQYSNLIINLRKDTQFVLICSTNFTRNWLHDILQQFHIARMTHAILLVPSEERINVYTYFPFSKNHCHATGPPVLMNSFLDGDFVRKNVNLFTEKKYWNMYGCHLTCIGNRQPPDSILAMEKNGEIVFKKITREVLNFLSEYLNFKPKIIMPSNNNSSLQHSWFFYNDTIDVITDYIANGKVDFAIGHFSRLAFTNHTHITFGKESRIECYTWAVPLRSGKRRLFLLNYLEEFNLEFWLLLAAFVFSAVGIVCLITYVLDENKTLQTPINVFFYIWSTLMNQPLPVKHESVSLRIFLSHWLVSILVITTAYQASLWSFMTIPWQVHNIQSIQDLLDSSLEVTGGAQMYNILTSLNSSNKQIQQIIQRFVILQPTDFYDIVNTIETERNLAVFGEKRHMSFYTTNFDQHFERDKVYFVDGCLLQSLATPLLVQTNSPLFEPMNTVLLRMLQTGLMNKLCMLYGHQLTLEAPQTVSFETPKEVPLDINRFTGVFVILMFGYLFASGIFICEILYFRLMKKQNEIKIIFEQKLYHQD